ncbi:MAG: GldG family protein, partial [Myxococcota bacterium]|nr:GldG family protein [Myxococcota bacterium]
MRGVGNLHEYPSRCARCVALLLILSTAGACSSRKRSADVDAGPAADANGADVTPDVPRGDCRNGMQDGDESGVDCGGSCPRCPTGDPCRSGADCVSGVCGTDGRCAVPTCEDDVQNGAETDVDCGGGRCPPCEAGAGCAMPEDCRSGLCMGNRCLPSACTDGTRNGTETGTDCGGGGCPPCPEGQGCRSAEDCTSRVCTDGTCRAPACTDRIRNGSESDVDCGGDGPCPRCIAGRRCRTTSDCESGVCSSVTGTCSPPNCTDRMRNGMETDVDCGGGGRCPRCPDGRACMAGSDCESGSCRDGTCVAPDCADGVRNGGESDVDCGGMTRCPRCRDRRRCSAPSDCMSDVCMDGRCGTDPTCHWGLIAQERQFEDMTIQGLFTDRGMTFEVLNNNGMTGTHSSSPDTLARFDAIVLHKHDRTLSMTERDALTAFVMGGGRLLVTGYDSLANPSDPLLAELVDCTGAGLDHFNTMCTVVDVSHPVLMGPVAS